MKLSRKLIPAFAMLLVSAIMMTTASYAWFSINTNVTAKGMKVNTTASDSVLIVEALLDGENSEKKVDDANFTTDLSQSVTGLLNPVSTVNGTSFFYTAGKNVEGDGDAKTDNYISYDKTAFNTAYGTSDAVAYVDYVFQIKATNASTSDAKDLYITALDLTYEGASDNNQKAFRVAVFAEEYNGSAFTKGVGTLKTILAPKDAAYHTDGSAVSSTTEVTAIDTDVLGANATLANIPANSTKYYKVVVRLWLEGEDTTCKNDTFANLAADKGWALNLTIELQKIGDPDVKPVNLLGTAVTSGS